ncbi:MAG: HAD-IIIC family phosphatase [Chitinophagaceae bacterium]
MNISIISDITFDPIVKRLSGNADISVNHYSYSDKIVPELLQVGNKLEGTDILLVHFDSYFFRYADSYIGEIFEAIHNLSGQFTGNILVSNNIFNGRHTSVLKNNIGQHEQLILEQESAFRKLMNSNNVYFYDFKSLVTEIGIQQAYNFKLGFLYQMPYTKSLLELLSTELENYIRFLVQQEKKAIFIDCDNTLWGGILGEDGMDGIQCDRNAKGILYFYFQEFLLEKKKEGFILGLCSKNNEADVKAAFEELNMPLKWDDFLIKKVNWQNKAENLTQAAEELNIGLSSFIFIDDNEFELQSINSLLPEVTTIKLTGQYTDFLRLTNQYVFKRKRLTKEDLGKTEQYYAEQKRNDVKASVGSFEDYVKSLEIKLDVVINNKNEFPRLSQLTEKTNQFNFNKEAFTITQLEKFVSDGSFIYSLKVADKFGDYGLVGLILMEVSGKNAVMRNFLMSCRALGRLIENDFFNQVKADLAGKGIELKDVLFKETAKNAPAKTFYKGLKAESPELIH